MSTPIFYLHVEARGVQAEVRLNDAPIIELFVEYPQHAFPTISEWVINGENVLSVHVQQADETAQLRITLCQASLGDIPEPGSEVELAIVEWPPPLPAGATEVAEVAAPPMPPMPPILRAVGFATHSWAPWYWQSAPPFTADRRSVAELITWLRDLHATLAAGQIDPLAANSQFKFSEVAPVYDMTTAEAQTRLTQTWAHISAQPGWEIAAFDEADVDLRVRCDGRLIEPCTRDGLPLIRQIRPVGGDRWSMPIFVGRTHRDYVAGYLAIVR
ncbi:hypothetical protein DB30_05938 [Enhygromyxa salina]|uniref:Uncharacterized protein n=1 Tax=Enhygromyxa salina TaxID=215803 RepID=A0A0C1ZNI5_9BACT|nr:hypothetical protein [Enhygromyxa salina]KIG19034.1 hypothetical protein DB30_05938 [Enhygromyxa salina]